MEIKQRIIIFSKAGGAGACLICRRILPNISLFFLIIFVPVSGFQNMVSKEQSNNSGGSYVRNSQKPLKGIVTLDLEVIKTINPYLSPEFGLRSYSFQRSAYGEVIFYDPNMSEAYFFNKEGNPEGQISKKGQGPGEFSEFGGFRPFFMNNEIWIWGSRKLAIFNKARQFIKEYRYDLSGYPTFLDDRYFISKERNRLDVSSIELKLYGMSDWKIDSTVTLFVAKDATWIKVSASKGFLDSWVTPDVFFCFNRSNRRIYILANNEYKIFVKDLDSTLLQTIENPTKRIKISKEEKRVMLGAALKYDPWILDVYPDYLLPIHAIGSLNNKYLYVSRVIGPKELVIDIFDADGRYLYELRAPKGISLENAIFNEDVISMKTEADDGNLIYKEYKIKNYPKLFGSLPRDRAHEKII